MAKGIVPASMKPSKPSRAKKGPAKLQIVTRGGNAKPAAELRSIVSNFIPYVPQSLLK